MFGNSRSGHLFEKNKNIVITNISQIPPCKSPDLSEMIIIKYLLLFSISSCQNGLRRPRF